MKKFRIFAIASLCLLMFNSCGLFNQSKEEIIFEDVDEPAMFPGGLDGLIAFLSQNIEYPQEARETGTEGIVYVTFVVEKDGSVSNVKILQNLYGGCGEEAVRVVKAMPKWTPAKHKGKRVRMQFNLPIKFTLAG